MPRLQDTHTHTHTHAPIERDAINGMITLMEMLCDWQLWIENENENACTNWQ